MVAPHTDLHFVLFPLMAQGHMVPMVDIAHMLAQHGATITIITTPLIANRFEPVIIQAKEAGLKINLLQLPLRLSEVGLPEGCESFDMLPSLEASTKLYAAIDMLEKASENLLQGLSPSPACIISDNIIPWTMDLARKFNIPRVVFHGPGCFWILCMHVMVTCNMLDKVELGSERFVLPGLPHRVEVTKVQVLGRSKEATEDEKRFWGRLLEAEKASYGILVHSFEELEPEYARELAKAKEKKIWCICPVSLCKKGNLDVSVRERKGGSNEQDCLKWLDEREPRSVLYVCLGSLTRMSMVQAVELALGLESTNRPFIWCVRNKTEELEKWFLEEGFEERVGERGLVVRGWAPQVLILSHRSIGGFLTHCGWNSTLEAVSAGVPIVTWPHFADQFFNEIFIVEILKIGVRIGVETPIPFGEEDEIGALVKKEDVKSVVECLMDEGEEGKRRREKAKELSEMAKRATEEGGSSCLNTASLIQDITERLNVMKSS